MTKRSLNNGNAWKPLVDTFGKAEDRHVDGAAQQHFGQRVAGRVGKQQFDAGVALAERLHEAAEHGRADGAHQADLQLQVVEPGEGAGGVAGGLRLREDALEIRQHYPAQLGEVSVLAFAMEQRTAEFRFEVLDGAGQAWLRDVGLLRRPGEIQVFRHRQEVLDLMQLHPAPPITAPRSYRSLSAPTVMARIAESPCKCIHISVCAAARPASITRRRLRRR